MGLLLGGSVLTVFELIDLIVFRFANTLCGAQNADADAADVGTEPGVSAELSMGPFRVTQPNPIQLTMELTVW